MCFCRHFTKDKIPDIDAMRHHMLRLNAVKRRGPDLIRGIDLFPLKGMAVLVLWKRAKIERIRHDGHACEMSKAQLNLRD